MGTLEKHEGSCLCGGVKFQTAGTLRPVVACHCGQCRKISGHFWAATQVSNDRLRLTCEETLGWYRSSGAARRGFCTHCGSSLFWCKDGTDTTSIAAGAFDHTGLSTAKHIYTKDKGDYYEIEAGATCL